MIPFKKHNIIINTLTPEHTNNSPIYSPDDNNEHCIL